MSITKRATRPVLARLLDKIEKRPDGCWHFMGCKLANGYGKISIARSKAAFAHRIAYREMVGPLEAGKVIMHSCDNKACVNPEHLRQGTQKENWQDAVDKGLGHAAPQVTPGYRYVNHYVQKRNSLVSTVDEA